MCSISVLPDLKGAGNGQEGLDERSDILIYCVPSTLHASKLHADVYVLYPHHTMLPTPRRNDDARNNVSWSQRLTATS